MNAVTAPARFFSRNSSSSPNTLNLKPNTLHLTPDADTFWALKDVSFEVQQGEVAQGGSRKVISFDVDTRWECYTYINAL